MKIKLISFGLKYNHTIIVDMQLDTRCLINPYYQDSLRELTGLDSRVSSYILMDSYTQEYLNSLTKYLDKYFEKIFTKKDEVTIGIVCTGGRHRSVFVTNYLYNLYKDKYDILVSHTDINE